MKEKIPSLLTPVQDLQRQTELLKLEYEYEKAQFRQQTELTGIERKVHEGLCWHPVSLGRSYYNSLNQFAVEIERTENRGTEHRFEPGHPVCFFTRNLQGQLRYSHFTGIAHYIEEDRMAVILPSPAYLSELTPWPSVGVQLYFDETSYQTMFEALADVTRAQNNRLARLRDILEGRTPAQEFTFHPLRFPWLNASQEKAVNKVLRAKDVAVVHGPPGTGKTTTLVEAVYETLHRENQVLVCAQSNTAVDWISEKLVERGINVLRIGNPTRVNDQMLACTFERRFEAHPDYPQLWSLRQAIRNLYQQKRKSGSREDFPAKINSLKDRATELEIRITETLFGEARVIASTLVSSANRLLTGRRFSTLFIDEAAQALEAACWIAIRKADRVILAGDPCQLSPTIKCMEAARAGLERTLIQKIIKQKPSCVSLLTLQYRMNNAIMEFPSRWFYQGKLQAAPEVRYRSILDYDTPVEWIDTGMPDYTEELIGESGSRANKEEAKLLVDTLENYLQKIGKHRIAEENIDFGIISPYKAQVHYLKSLLKKSAVCKPFRSLITVQTVDGFQGQERDVILISLVRANDKGQIGFLNDLRRMNVAITRARMKLILLGDISTLAKHSFYRKLYEYVESIRTA